MKGIQYEEDKRSVNGDWKLTGLKLFFRSEERAKAKLIIPFCRFCRDGMWMLLEATDMIWAKRISDSLQGYIPFYNYKLVKKFNGKTSFFLNNLQCFCFMQYLCILCFYLTDIQIIITYLIYCSFIFIIYNIVKIN